MEFVCFFCSGKVRSIRGSIIFEAGGKLLGKFNMLVFSLATCYWFIDWGKKNKQLTSLSGIIALHLPSLCAWYWLAAVHQWTSHICVCTGAGGWTLPLLPGSILTFPSLSDGGRCGRVKGWWSCATFVWPASIHPQQAVGRGVGEGCGRGWSRAGLNDKGFVQCCDSYQDSLSQTIAGVTGP